MPRFLGFLGRTVSEGGAFAVGQATSNAISPLLQDLVNETWSLHPSVPLDVTILADGVATGEISMAAGKAQAELTGFNGTRFEQLVTVIDRGPGIGQAFRLWRRKTINDDGFARAAKRAGLEPEWIAAMLKTKTEPLDPAVLANAIQQGFIPGAGLLSDDSGGDAPFTPPSEQVDVNAVEEAGWQGVPSEHLRVLAQLSGNPPGPQTLLEMWRKGIITEQAVENGLREGRTKTKWTGAIKANRFALLTGIQAVNLWLRGWISEGEAKGHARKQGYTDELTNLLFLGQGRPLSMRQAWIGHQRGGDYDGGQGGIPDFFLRALRQSSIRPEWYNLAWAQRYTYPSAFVLRALTADGTFTAAQTEEALIHSGWREDWARQAARKWAAGGSGDDRELTASDLLTEYESNLISEATYQRELTELGYTPEAVAAKVRIAGTRLRVQARKQLIGRIHTSYVTHKIQRAEAASELSNAGVDGDQVGAILSEWTQEAEVNVSRMTPAQVVKAFKKSLISRAAAFDRLTELRYPDNEANLLLDSA